jgi:hypothetical protein
MDIAALITWVLTAGGGFTLLALWLSRRRQPARVAARDDAPAQDAGVGGTDGRPRLTPGLVFTHAGLAVAGLLLWIAYLASDSTGVARTTAVVVLLVAVLGFTMLARWIRGRTGARADASSGGGRPEDAFPVPLVAAHGLLAAITLVLVLLVAVRG